jgi:hypothetical protein
MSQDAPVLAARDGTVIFAQASQVDGSNNLDLLDKANEVRIQHVDGTISIYGHLAFGGVHVYPGQRVKSGDQIGLAGSTGYSTGPHLHFAVQTIVRNGDELVVTSLPFKFFVGVPPNPVSVFSPQYGMVVAAHYTTPPVPVVMAATPAFSSPASRPSEATELALVLEWLAPVRVFLRGVPFWAWLAMMTSIVVWFILREKSEHERRRRDSYFVREPTIRSRSTMDDKS